MVVGYGSEKLYWMLHPPVASIILAINNDLLPLCDCAVEIPDTVSAPSPPCSTGSYASHPLYCSTHPGDLQGQQLPGASSHPSLIYTAAVALQIEPKVRMRQMNTLIIIIYPDRWGFCPSVASTRPVCLVVSALPLNAANRRCSILQCNIVVFRFHISIADNDNVSC